MANSIKLISGETDGATAVAHELDSVKSFVTSGGKLFSVKNAGNDRFSIDLDGKIGLPANLQFAVAAYQPDNATPAFRFRNLRSGQGGNSTMLEIHNSSDANIFQINDGGDVEIASGKVVRGKAGGCQIEFLSNQIVVRGGTVNVRGDSGSGFNCELLIQNTNTGKFGGSVSILASPTYPLLWNGGGQSPTFLSDADDTEGFDGLRLDTEVEFTKPNMALLRVRNDGTDRLAIDKTGNLLLQGEFVAPTEIADADPVAGFMTITVTDNTFDGGEWIRFRTLGTAYVLTEDSEWSVGADTDETAGNIADAINAETGLKDVVSANAVGSVVTVTAVATGKAGERIAVDESDGATDNLTLSANRLSGGDNDGLGFVLDTWRKLSEDSDRRLLSVRNGFLEKFAISPDGNVDIVGEVSMKVYSQDDEPTLTADNRMAMWIDSNDSDRVYLVFRRGSGDQVKVELT